MPILIKSQQNKISSETGFYVFEYLFGLPKKTPHSLNFTILITFIPPLLKTILYNIKYFIEKTNHNEIWMYSDFLSFGEFLQHYISHQKFTILTKILS